MRIKSKLLVLLAVPLLALGIAATLGFRSQSVDAAEALTAQARIEQVVAIHEATDAVAGERLAGLGVTAMGDTEALRIRTDAAISTLPAAGVGFTDATLSTVNDSLEAARAATDPWEAAAAYSAINVALLDSTQRGAADFTEAETLNSWIVSSVIGESLEIRDQAWLAYFANANSATPDAAAVLRGFTLAEQAETNALRLAGGADQALLESFRTTSEAVTMRNIETLAANDLLSGEFTISPDQALAARAADRQQLANTLRTLDSNLLRSAADDVAATNNLRQIYTLLGLVGAVVLGGLVFVIYRSITNPLAHLLNRADHIASVQLPALVQKLRTTDSAEQIPSPPQIKTKSNDEIGDLVHAFNQVQSTAHRLATEQAISRRNVSDMFINLGRRNQQLLQRMISMVTDLEQEQDDPETLESLFALDHMVTRMRRNAESLLVLAGTQPPRQWSKPVLVENAVRNAMSEVEGYQRVQISWLDPVRVQGSAVADVTHMLAELVENALAFSDPSMHVQVDGEVLSSGAYLLSVTDFGIGMDTEEFLDNNLRISDPPPLDLAPTRRLGLFVVGRLAERYDIRVTLVPGARQGTVARIELPVGVLANDGGRSELDAPAERLVIEQPLAEEVEELPEIGSISFDDLDLGVDTAGTDQNQNVTAHDVRAHDEDPDERDLPAAYYPPSVTAEETSPLELQHDIDRELERLTQPESAEESGFPQDAPAGLLPLPTRQPMGQTPSAPAYQPRDAQPGPAPQPSATAVQPSAAAPVADVGGLPTRNPGGLVAAPANRSTDSRPAPAEDTEAQASQFSSLMSAFSSGVNKGLEDSEDAIDADRRAQ